MIMTWTVNAVLWGVQLFLAFFFLLASIPKLSGRGLDRWTGFDSLPQTEAGFIGLMELLGAMGLVLPMATRIMPWLTPLAAIGLAVNVLMAAGFHARADERLEMLETVLWASIAGCIAIGRWYLVAAGIEIRPSVLLVAFAILVPAAITNVTILLRRPPRTSTSRQAA
jgi:DoxX-like family